MVTQAPTGASARPSSSTSASPRSARAPPRAAPAPRPTAAPRTTWPGAHPLRRRLPRGRRLRARPDALGDVDLPRPRAGLQAAREADAAADHVRRPAGLSIDEIKQVFRCLADDPQQRLPARHMRFFNPVTLTTNPMQVPRERLDPGPRRGATRRRSSSPRSRRSLPPSPRTRRSSWARWSRSTSRTSRSAAGPTTTSSSPRRP
jgi:hypothetical protein